MRATGPVFVFDSLPGVEAAGIDARHFTRKRQPLGPSAHACKNDASKLAANVLIQTGQNVNMRLFYIYNLRFHYIVSTLLTTAGIYIATANSFPTHTKPLPLACLLWSSVSLS